MNGSCPNGCDKGTHGDKCNKGRPIYDKWHWQIAHLASYLYIQEVLEPVAKDHIVVIDGDNSPGKRSTTHVLSQIFLMRPTSK